jgi:hypothetical protein
MDPNALAGMAFTLVLTVLVGGFILLLPISRRVGQLLESKLQEKKLPGLPAGDLDDVQRTLHSLESEVRRVAERQDFIEKLLSSEKRATLPPNDS